MAKVERRSDSHKEVSSTVPPEVYELVWREFKRTCIHEVLLQICKSRLKKWEDSINKGRSLFPTSKLTTWQDLIFDPVFGDRSADYDPLFLGCSPHYHSPRNNRFFYHGFPLPEQGGVLHQWGDESRVRIFMDDLFLCPDCGGFHPFQRNWPKSPWLDTMHRRTDVQAMFEAIEQRRHSAEFNFRRCENREDCETITAIFRAEFERENQLERERLAWATKVKEMTQRIFALPEQIEKVIETNFESDQKRNQFVYLIGSNDYVKIGIATNVKKRFSSLQTASPVPLKLLKSWRCANAWTKELKLHRRYARFRQNGEWFRLSDRVLNRLLAIEDLDAFFKRR